VSNISDETYFINVHLLVYYIFYIYIYIYINMFWWQLPPPSGNVHFYKLKHYYFKLSALLCTRILDPLHIMYQHRTWLAQMRSIAEVVEHHRGLGCRSSGSNWHCGVHVIILYL